MTYARLLDVWPYDTKRDYQFFWIWPSGRYAEDQILFEITQKFTVIATIEVSWPGNSAARSFNRIYARNLHNTWSREMSAGSGASRLVIVLDRNPDYGFVRSASGSVEYANRNCVRAKRSMRLLAGRHYGFAIHSSMNRREFLRDVLLVLGPDILNDIMLKEIPRNEVGATVTSYRVEEAPIGHQGWDSWAQLLDVLGLLQQFVVLSGEDALSNTEPTGDVDILTEDIWEFAATANAELQQLGSSKPRFVVEVAGAKRLLDLREPGDGDMPLAWQERLLRAPAAGRSNNFLAEIERVPYRLFRVLCQKASHSTVCRESELAFLLDQAGVASENPFDDAREFVAGYLAGNQISVLGVRGDRLGSPHEWDAVVKCYASIVSQAEPTWKIVKPYGI